MVDFIAPLQPAAAQAAEPMSVEHAPEVARHDGTARRPGAISVVVVDDHAAVRLGLTTAISSRPGLVCVGAVPDGELLPALLYRVRPDVVVLDYALPRGNGLELCRRVKADVHAPAVVLYSAYADLALAIPAFVAGVDAMVHKGAPVLELFAAIEAVAEGEKLLPAPVSELAEAARGAVDAADRPMLELLVRQTPRPDVAAQLNLSHAELALRIHRMLERLDRRAQ